MRIRAAAVLVSAIAFALAVIGAGCGGGGGDEEGAAATTAPAAETGASTQGSSSGTDTAGGEPIVIGYAIAKTGPFATYDMLLLNGGKIAVEDINSNGGVLGRKLEIVDCDTKSSINNSAPCAKEVIAQGAQFVISTSDYDFGGPALREANAEGFVGFSLAGDTKLGYHGVGPLAFNAYPGSPTEGAAAAEFAFEKGWKRPYTLTDTINSYPPTLTEYFTKRWMELSGSDVVGKDLFLNSDPSIATQITRIKQANPDVILVSSFPPGGASAIKQIRAAGITTPILGGAGFDGTYWTEGIPDLSDVYRVLSASPNGDDPSADRNEFFEKYEQFTGEAPVLGLYSVAGYSQVQILAEGIEAAGTTEGSDVAAAIAELTDFPALIGPTTYAWREECNLPAGRPFLIFEIQRGTQSFVREITPEQVPPFEC